MSHFRGYTQEQKYRVAWLVDTASQATASESMTLNEAIQLKSSLVDVVDSWLEQWNGYEWEKVSR